MRTMIMATLSSKAQITLPKRIRELLGLREKGERVGFVVDEKTRRIVLTKMTLVPAEESYTEEELRKLLKLAKTPGKKTFASAEAFLKHVRSL